MYSIEDLLTEYKEAIDWIIERYASKYDIENPIKTHQAADLFLLNNIMSLQKELDDSAAAFTHDGVIDAVNSEALLTTIVNVNLNSVEKLVDRLPFN